MNKFFGTALAAALIAISAHAQTAVRSHANTIVVERPSDLPEVARTPTLAMYLHETSAGEADLYLEQNGGTHLAILDVTDPASIRPVARVTLDAKAPFSFVRSVGDNAVLIRYRGNAGVAVLNLRHPHRPVLTAAPRALEAPIAARLGQTALLVNASTQLAPAAPVDPSYNVVDLTASGGPVLLASVANVSQSLDRRETGTLFLLNPDGLTIVRRMRIEQSYRDLQVQMEHN
jgi:hypothetical protein